MTNRPLIHSDTLALNEMVAELVKNINTDVLKTNEYSREPVTFFQQQGTISWQGVQLDIVITARYPGWEDYLKKLENTLKSRTDWEDGDDDE